jgi:hypothetical protein
VQSIDITAIVRNDYSGNCELFAVPRPYDFISWVVGVSEEQALQIQLQIELGGYVKALLAPGSIGRSRQAMIGRGRGFGNSSVYPRRRFLGRTDFSSHADRAVDFDTLPFRESMHGVNDDES